MLYGWVGEVSSTEFLPNLPPEELESIVCVSTPAIKLCGFCVGEPVLVKVRGCSLVKSVWPISDNSVTSILVPKEGLEVSPELLNAPVTVKKIPYPIPPAQEITISFQSSSASSHPHLSDILLVLQHKYCGKYLRAGSILSIPHYGRKLRFSVSQIKAHTPCQESIVANSPNPLESITESLQSMSFSEPRFESETPSSTPLRKQRVSRRAVFESVSSSEPTPVQRLSRRAVFESASSSEQTPVRNPVRNMLEDSYAESSTEESRDELSTTIDSLAETPSKDVFEPPCEFYHVVHSSEWQMKEDSKNVDKNISTKEKLISSIGGLQNVIDEVRELMTLALSASCPWTGGLKVTKGVLLFGPSGTGKTVLAHALAQDSAASVHVLMVSELFSKVLGETDSRLRSFFSGATSSGPAVIILDEIDSLCSKKASSSGSELERRVITLLCTLLDELSSGNKRVFVIATTGRLDAVETSLRRPGRLDREIEVPVPTPDGRLQILQILLKSVPNNLSEAELLSVAQAAHGFVGADLASLVSQAGTYALKNAGKGSNLGITIEHMQWALGRINPSAMREVLVDVPNVRWSDIGGQEELKLKLKQAVEWPLSHPEAFERLGIRPPRGVLMFGPPGCSKTMIAKALATESKLNFLSIKGPELFSKWVGESERAVREVFRRARQVAPAIVFFDELDALGGERGSGGGGGGSNVQERVLAQLLTEMDGVTALGNVTVVAATNRPDRIDKALLRPGRLDRIVYVPLPDANTRRQIFDLQIKVMPISKELNVDYLVEKTEGYSGAEVLAVCHEAALKALEEDISAQIVTTQHFDLALQIVSPRTPPSLLKLYEDYLNR